ncbi:MAG: hypothetical protein HQ530_01560 [Parcubacteria group bacterium]|nr:hypothetical protein [Parcubacteria group bacterium]
MTERKKGIKPRGCLLNESEEKAPSGPPMPPTGEMILSYFGPGGDFVDNGVPIEAQRTDQDLVGVIAARQNLIRS